MALHIRDRETDKLVRELARRRGVGLTEAIRDAVRHEMERDADRPSLWERTAHIRGRLNANADPNFVADKAFYDRLSGEDPR